MKVMVPTGAADAVGLRVVMSKREADQVLAVFRVQEKAVAADRGIDGSGPTTR